MLYADMLRVAPLLVALACVPNDPGDADTGTAKTVVSDTTSSTDSSPVAPAALVGSCSLTSAPTVARCTVEADRPVPLSVEWAAPHLERPRQLERQASQRHEFDVPLLTEQTAWTWTLRSSDAPGVTLTGELETGVVGPSRFQLEAEGSPVNELVAFAGRCAGAGAVVVFDTTTLRLAMLTELVDVQPEGLRITEGGNLLVTSRAALTEVEPSGVIAKDVSVEGLNAHHDGIDWLDGYAVLVKQNVDLEPPDYRTDDGLVFLDDGGGEVARVWLSDVIAPGEATRDWSHANTVARAEQDGALLVSLRSQSAVFQLAADPSKPDFGALQWWLAGWDEESQLARPSDFELVDSLGNPEVFKRQHDPNWMADGRLTLFDNGVSSEASRVLDLSVDWDRLEVVVDQVWQLDRHCDYQGGARALPGGGRLATCSPQGQVFGFSAEQPSRHAWGASALCETDGGYITRALPAPW